MLRKRLAHHREIATLVSNLDARPRYGTIPFVAASGNPPPTVEISTRSDGWHSVLLLRHLAFSRSAEAVD